MRLLRIPSDRLDAGAVAGRVLTHDVGPGLRKGTVLEARHLPLLGALAEVHVVELEPGDLHEDEAARRLGAAVSGEGTRVEGPVQSQVRLVAERRGLLRVARAAVERLNRLPAVGVFTLVDGQAVEAGWEVAGAKVTPVAVPASLVEEAESLAAEHGPVTRVEGFRPLRTLIVVTERLKPRARRLFADAVGRKLGWYGARVLEVREVARSDEAVRGAYEASRRLGAELVLFAGASSIDPLDAAYAQLAAAGGRLVRQGAPAHPGSMLWLGGLDGAVVLGVASCAGFGKNTSLDLVLPFLFAYGEVRDEDIAGLGYGGLIEEGAGRRFPPYP